MAGSANIDRLIDSMSFAEKVGQLNQRLLGWRAVERDGAGRLVASDTLRREIDRWGGLGVLYGLLRADPWSGRHWGNGIRPEERPEAIHVVQETVLERGAHGIGALLSEEAPHGHQALGGTVLPTNLALGATFDPAAVRRAEEAVAGELAASGIHIALVSGLDIARDPRWGRCEECFGEDPLMAARMCEAIVLGMQGENRSRIGHGGVAVVLKHLAAQGEAVGGRNGQSAIIGPHDLHEIHLPPVVAGVKAGAWGFMAAYNDIDSLPCCANPKLLKDYLRGRLGFDGIVMADGLAVDRLEDMCGSIPEAGRAALLAGVDVSLWDQGFPCLTQYADDETVVRAVDASLRRVLELKAAFGLLPDAPGGKAAIPQPQTEDIHHAIGITRECSEELARESLVLLSDGDQPGMTDDDNDGKASLDVAHTIMADDTAGPIVVAGPFADDCGCFLGDYTAPLTRNDITSVYRRLRDAMGKDRVLPAPHIDDLAVETWNRASLVVFVCGSTSERSYDSQFDDNGAAKAVAEHGATCGEGVDLSDITLPWHQDELLDAILERTDAAIVSVVVCGRAHVLRHVIEASSVTLWAGYAGQFGPQAVTAALTGSEPIPGRLPVTLPAYPAAIPVRYNDRQSASHVYKDATEPVLCGFGYGLGALDGVTVGRPVVDVDVHLRIVHVTTTVVAGARNAQGALNLFAHVSDGRHVPRMAMLVDSRRLDLVPNEARTVTFEVPFGRLMPDEDATSDRVVVSLAFDGAFDGMNPNAATVTLLA